MDATDAIVDPEINFRRHPPFEQARLPGLSSRFTLFWGSKSVPRLGVGTSPVQRKTPIRKMKDFST